jgi:hypothetical protein
VALFDQLSGGDGGRHDRLGAGADLYIVLQRYIIEGVATSGLKG